MVLIGDMANFPFSLSYVRILFLQPSVFYMKTGFAKLRSLSSAFRREKSCLKFCFILFFVGVIVLFSVVCTGCFIAGCVLWRICRAVFTAVLAVYRISGSCFVSTVVACFVLIFIIFCHFNIPPGVILGLPDSTVVFLLHQLLFLFAAEIIQDL